MLLGRPKAQTTFSFGTCATDSPAAGCRRVFSLVTPQRVQAGPVSRTGALAVQRLDILPASPAAEEPISRPATDSATSRRSVSLMLAPTTGFMMPLVRAS